MRRPIDLLRMMSAGTLAALLEARPDLTRPRPHTLQELAGRASTHGSLWAAVRELDAFASAVLDGLCLLPDSAAVEEVADAVGSDVEATRRTLGRLADLLMVDLHGGRARLLPAVRQVIPNPGGLGPGVRDALAYTPFHVLRQIVGHLGMRGAPDRDALLVAIESALRDHARVDALVADLPPEVRDVIFGLGEDASHRYRTSVRPWDGGETRTVLDWAQSRGLIAIDPWGGLTMPAEIGRYVRGRTLVRPVPADIPLIAVTPVDQDDIDRHAARGAVAIVGQVAALLGECDERPLTILKSGGIGVREVRRVAKAVDVTEADAARLLELALAADLIGAIVNDEVIVPAPGADRWVSGTPVERWLGLAAAWLASARYPSLAGALGQDGKPVPPLTAHTGPDATGPRLEVLVLIGGLPDGVAPDAETVAAAAAWSSPRRWGDAPASVEELAIWTLCEAEALGVTGHFALSRAGRALLLGDLETALAAAQAVLPPPLTSFTIQADLTALVPGVLEPGLAAVLSDAADQESSGAATMWRFSEASIRRAMDRGRTAEELDAFLAEHATHGVPQTLTYLIADVARRHGHLRIAAVGTVIHADDPALLAEVVRHRKLSKLRLRLVAPTVAVGPGTQAAALDALRSAGFLPVAEKADGTISAGKQAKRRADAVLSRPDRRPQYGRAPMSADEAAGLAKDLLARSRSGEDDEP